jgi:hypothetical protein
MAASPRPWSRAAIEAGVLVVVALGVRLAAAWALGGGAPFGPDGTGLQASIALGGHPYPLHTLLLQPIGDVRTLSLASGTLACWLMWVYGRRVGLGGGGGWLLAFLPLGVYPSALAAGDAPALLLVLAGATLATFGKGPATLGGAVAMASVAVKPIALPALVLLAPTPFALLGALLAYPFAMRWLGPLLTPRPHGGLLGTWWVASNGEPPSGADGWIELWVGGAQALLDAPLWACVPLAGFAAVGALWPRAAPSPPTVAVRVAVLVPLVGLLATAALFGDRVEPRYLAPSLVALLPWAGAVLPRGVEALLLWPTAAVITQVAAVRADLDPSAGVPTLPVVAPPEVDARPLFNEASTRGATAMRAEATRLAAELPEGATIEVERRAHGREGELTWPLQVLRPDVRVEVIDP